MSQETLTAFDGTESETTRNDTDTDAVTDVTAWKTQVTINDEKTCYVGEQVSRHPKTWRLLELPESQANGIAGYLQYSNGFRDSPDEIRFFEPGDTANEFDDSEYSVVVSNINVKFHNRCEQLSAVLPLIRNKLVDANWIEYGHELPSNVDLSERRYLNVIYDNVENVSETDWVAVDPDTSYSEWGKATNSLIEFYRDMYGDVDVGISISSINKPRVRHGLARYPLDGYKIVSHVQKAFIENEENPEVFREVLFDYAKYWTCLSTVPVEITHGFVE